MSWRMPSDDDLGSIRVKGLQSQLYVTEQTKGPWGSRMTPNDTRWRHDASRGGSARRASRPYNHRESGSGRWYETQGETGAHGPRCSSSIWRGNNDHDVAVAQGAIR